jgi:hypothetical protein
MTRNAGYYADPLAEEAGSRSWCGNKRVERGRENIYKWHGVVGCVWRLEQVHQRLALAQLLDRHLVELGLGARRNHQSWLALVGAAGNHARLAEGLHGACAVQRGHGRGSHVGRRPS